MNRIHFIGIKGCGMSAAAQYMHDMGYLVTGEDVEKPLFTQTALEARGIPLYPFGEAPLSPDMKAIASNAYADGHPSIVRCRELGIPVERYHHFLGETIGAYTSVAVTGSHGKTTTTGMLAHALQAAEPVCSLIGDGTGSGSPDARLFVFESCEYRRHFLAYRPDIAVITNIDFDHPDYFADIDDVRTAFGQMADLTGRLVVACGDDPQIGRLETSTERMHYGFGPGNDLRASGLRIGDNGQSFDVHYKDTALGRFSIPAFGRHNALNALAVIGVALALDQDMNAVRSRMAAFAGVRRRFSEKAWRSNVVIDDYAHHPAEISATLEAARSKYPQHRLVAVFQPHTYSRLEKLMGDFALSLREADDVFLCDIFGSARESVGAVSIESLQALIPNARLLSVHAAANDLAPYENSALVFMGAGDIQKYEEMLLRS